MMKAGKKNKMMVNTIGEFNMLKRLMKKDAFYAKFELSIGLVTKIAARDGISRNLNTEAQLDDVEKKEFMTGKWKTFNLN